MWVALCKCRQQKQCSLLAHANADDLSTGLCISCPPPQLPCGGRDGKSSVVDLACPDYAAVVHRV
jgi:hypothetical protein